jgi:hypothetical protein
LVPKHNWIKNPLTDTEVILHRFGLRNHYRLELGKDSEKATQNMKDLFAVRFDIDDLIAIIGHEYENEANLIDALLDIPIVLAIGNNFPLNAQEKKELNKNDDRIKLALVHTLGYMNQQSTSLEEMHVAIRQLGHKLDKAKSQTLRKKAQKSLVQLLLEHVPSLGGQKTRCDLIAPAYLNALVDNAGIKTLTEFIAQTPITAVPQKPATRRKTTNYKKAATHRKAAVPA